MSAMSPHELREKTTEAYNIIVYIITAILYHKRKRDYITTERSLNFSFARTQNNARKIGNIL